MQCRRQIERDYSAQNARAKISISHAKVHVFKFCGYFTVSYFRVLVVGRENLSLYGMLWQMFQKHFGNGLESTVVSLKQWRSQVIGIGRALAVR